MVDTKIDILWGFFDLKNAAKFCISNPDAWYPWTKTIKCGLELYFDTYSDYILPLGGILLPKEDIAETLLLKEDIFATFLKSSLVSFTIF